ncbi:hypothetical protein ETH_00040025 [Eimeria tenella]|uniref:Uncharacterized protein n=1 Tax=Eimeria tenella TaxID=5802 RepID=U6KWY7_EIMTE|nr:hypothetical protein ETH_00040025 [Eimeria tenella]CDJ40010.1 hypothetical protein ETH_00040025 [Eimeria tenella]|eukprot:XP_013230763.1 hypothetical protein ETH_00040025 [Eimeria tenella]
MKDKAAAAAAAADSSSSLGSGSDSEQSLEDFQDAELHPAAKSLLLKFESEEDSSLRWDPLEAVDELAVLREAFNSLPAAAAQQLQQELGAEKLGELVGL